MFELALNPSSNVAMLKFRQTLPCYQKKEEILKCMKDHQVVVISGETGCGKTTQVPQFLWSAKLVKDKKVAITQPRRVAAVSLAKRVAKEMRAETRR